MHALKDTKGIEQIVDYKRDSLTRQKLVASLGETLSLAFCQSSNDITKPNHQVHHSSIVFTSPPSSKEPEAIGRYFQHLMSQTGCSGEAMIMAVFYIYRVATLNTNFPITPSTIFRLLLSSLLLSTKYFDDLRVSNADFAHHGGVTKQELGCLERELFSLLNFDLHVSADDYERIYKQILDQHQTKLDDSMTQVPQSLIPHLSVFVEEDGNEIEFSLKGSSIDIDTNKSLILSIPKPHETQEQQNPQQLINIPNQNTQDTQNNLLSFNAHAFSNYGFGIQTLNIPQVTQVFRPPTPPLPPLPPPPLPPLASIGQTFASPKQGQIPSTQDVRSFPPDSKHTSIQKPIQKPLRRTESIHPTHTTQQVIPQPIQRSIQQPIQQPIHQPIQQPIQQPIHQPIQQPIHPPINQPIQQVVHTPFQLTNQSFDMDSVMFTTQQFPCSTWSTCSNQHSNQQFHCNNQQFPCTSQLNQQFNTQWNQHFNSQWNQQFPFQLMKVQPLPPLPIPHTSFFSPLVFENQIMTNAS